METTSESRMTEMAIFLIQHHVPSISPQTGHLLVGIVEAIDAIPNPPKELQVYRVALKVVINVGVLHQAAVIQGLETLVDGMGGSTK